MTAGGNREPIVDPAQLNDVPVEIRFDLGTASLPLGALRALGEGQVFRLSRGLTRAVDIRFSGELIGHGELVMVDEELAVRITQVGSR